MQEFFHHWILVKINIAPIHTSMHWLLQNFAHMMKAQPSWGVQKFGLTYLLGVKIFIKFFHQTAKTFERWILCTQDQLHGNGSHVNSSSCTKVIPWHPVGHPNTCGCSTHCGRNKMANILQTTLQMAWFYTKHISWYINKMLPYCILHSQRIT